jgi:COP9 signalosome complex subunit 2
MLSDSKINVFDSQEAKPYEQDPAIVAMNELTFAFLHQDIARFESILNREGKGILYDGFIKHYIDNLLRTIRSNVCSIYGYKYDARLIS